MGAPRIEKLVKKSEMGDPTTGELGEGERDG